MYELEQQYLSELETIASEIQESDELARYLDSEEEEDFTRLKELYEPRIAFLYEAVAKDNPLQLISFELVLLDQVFEGLFLPKILGYSVIRGEVNEQVKYVRPQEHFKDILLAICESTNFEILKKRIGQTIQIGFALSSDIWITNLINSISNKRIRYYLQGQKLDRYRRDSDRQVGLARYLNQFRNDHFHTAEFPTSAADLPVLFNPLKHFLIHRAAVKVNNSSLLAPIDSFIANENLQGTPEHMQIMAIYAMFYDMSEASRKQLTSIFNKIREKSAGFGERFLHFLMELHHEPTLQMLPEADKKMSTIVDKTFNDKLSEYYQLLDVVHDKGYTDEESHEAIKVFYNKHEGMSTINECVRQTIFQYFNRFISGLEERHYPELFDISKQFPIYMRIFLNEQFNQGLKDLSMHFVTRALAKFTDKRGKDYQDIKKFMASAFVDFGFLKEKEVVEMFKTRRKKKTE
jgi:hypothetical protein